MLFSVMATCWIVIQYKEHINDQQSMCFCLVNKALQDFDLALRGKKKRAKFLKEGKKKVLSVWASVISLTPNLMRFSLGQKSL